MTTYKKRAIPEAVRRQVAERYGCPPGERIAAACHWCSRSGGAIDWQLLSHGRPGGYVRFVDLELDHVVPEFVGGINEASNLVLACRTCNRRRGHRSRPNHVLVSDEDVSDHSRKGREQGMEGKVRDLLWLLTLRIAKTVTREAQRSGATR